MTDAPSVKQNANGVYFLDGEQLWDSDILPVCLEQIKEGDTVIDAGAWIGGHTMAYAEKVGATGQVIAFEPNPSAFECLYRNTKKFPNVKLVDHALGDEVDILPFSIKVGWQDSGHISRRGIPEEPTVVMSMLDEFNLAPNFIKIDVEGCELKVLKGAVKTIEKHRPIMVLEINRPALARQGDTREQVFDWLCGQEYVYKHIDNYMNDVYNILAIP